MAKEMANLGELDIIARFSGWQYFSSQTFSGVEPNTRTGTKLFFAHLYRVAKLHATPFHRLVWAWRVEAGETFGRLHYHALIGGCAKGPNLGLCFTMNHLWDELPLCGFARHRIYNRVGNAVEYVASCLAFAGSAGADFYETMKFGIKGTDITLSNSLLLCVGGRRVDVGRDVSKSQCGKKRLMRTVRSISDWACYSYGKHPAFAP